MCSTNGGELGRICRAIDDLEAGSPGADDPAPGAGDDDAARVKAAPRAGGDNPDIARLAAIWEMVADADPELAKRLPGYLYPAE